MAAPESSPSGAVQLIRKDVLGGLAVQARATPAEVAAPEVADLRLPGSNALMTAAGPLLALMVQLRQAPSCRDVPGLKASTEAGIRAFEEQALAAGIAGATVNAARYLLCAALDEAAMATGWGRAGAWSTGGLLMIFHEESWGGDKSFAIIDQVSRQPDLHKDLLELAAALLALGYQGRTARDPDGAAERTRRLEELAALTRRPPPAWRPLARSDQAPRPRRRRTPPAWVAPAVAALALIGLFVLFDGLLAGESAAVLERLREVAP